MKALISRARVFLIGTLLFAIGVLFIPIFADWNMPEPAFIIPMGVAVIGLLVQGWGAYQIMPLPRKK